jgi:regulator of protease activity HflC (stomatin/prohibitin superfamily)
MGPEEAAAAQEEIRKAMAEKVREQQEKLAREQQERGDRLELLYRGPPSGRER